MLRSDSLQLHIKQQLQISKTITHNTKNRLGLKHFMTVFAADTSYQISNTISNTIAHKYNIKYDIKYNYTQYEKLAGIETLHDCVRS